MKSAGFVIIAGLAVAGFALAGSATAKPTCPAGTHWYEAGKACVGNGGHSAPVTDPTTDAKVKPKPPTPSSTTTSPHG